MHISWHICRRQWRRPLRWGMCFWPCGWVFALVWNQLGRWRFLVLFFALCQNLFCRSCGCLVCGFGSERRGVRFLPCSFRRGFRIMRFFMRRLAGKSCRGCMRICRRFSRCWLSRMRCRCAFWQPLFWLQRPIFCFVVCCVRKRCHCRIAWIGGRQAWGCFYSFRYFLSLFASGEVLIMSIRSTGRMLR